MKDPRSGIAAAPPIPDIRKRSRRGKPLTAENVIEKQIVRLAEWAEENRRDARSERFQYFLLKLPAIISATGGSILQFYDQYPAVHIIAMVLPAIAAFCIAIDTVLPRGQLHNTHLRAYHELAHLVNEVELDWDRIEASQPPFKDIELQQRVDAILSRIRAERERVAAYIKSAETALSEASNPMPLPPKDEDK